MPSEAGTPSKVDFETLLLSEIKQKEKPALKKQTRVALGSEINCEKNSTSTGKYMLKTSKLPTKDRGKTKNNEETTKTKERKIKAKL